MTLAKKIREKSVEWRTLEHIRHTYTYTKKRSTLVRGMHHQTMLYIIVFLLLSSFPCMQYRREKKREKKLSSRRRAGEEGKRVSVFFSSFLLFLSFSASRIVKSDIFTLTIWRDSEKLNSFFRNCLLHNEQWVYFASNTDIHTYQPYGTQ